MTDWTRAMTRNAVSTFALIVGCAFTSVNVRAQGAPPAAAARGEVRGKIVSGASQAPVAQANVEVLAAAAPVNAPANAPPPAPVARASSDAAGRFVIRNVPAGRYLVRVRAIGFAVRQFPAVEVGSGAAGVDLGTIALTVAPLELKAQKVTAEKDEIQLAPDRNTFVVKDMPTTRGGTVIDVLRNIPAVDVDIDNIVSLRGNTGVKVQVNGRPSPMKPAQLGNYLAQLPADMVEKVEIVTNPSAREDPDGVAGIINIVLRQKADAGTSGGLTFGGGSYGHVDVGGNIGHQNGPWTFFGSYGFLTENRPRTDAITRENLYLTPRTFLDQSGQREQQPFSHTVTASATYKPDKKNDFTAELAYSTRDAKDSYGIIYRDLDASRALTALRDRRTSGTGSEGSLEGTLSYKHSFGTGHRISSELTLVRDHEGGFGQVTARQLALTGSPLATTALEDANTTERPHDNAFKVDYSRLLGGGVRLETGVKGSLLHFKTSLDTRVFNSGLGVYTPDASRTNAFDFEQTVQAAYGILSTQRGKFLAQTGVRLERATTQFTVGRGGSAYDNSYSSAFPSALISYRPDEEHQVKLSYATRIRRQDEPDQLDPQPRYSDPLNLSVGDPKLRPEFIRALELGFQRTADALTTQLTFYFRRTNDVVRSVRSVDTLGVITRRFVNLSTNDAYGADLTLARNGERLSGFVGTSAYWQVSNGSNVGTGLNVRTFGLSGRASVSLRATETLDAQALLSYEAPIDVPQGHNDARSRFSIAARQKLMRDRVGVTLRVIDPFSMSREHGYTVDPRFTQESDRRRSIRGLSVSVSWMFGKGSKDRDEETLLKDGAP
jgi:hypothetical protein